jgi:hypothetical protein
MTEWELAVQYADKVAKDYIGVKSDYGGYANIRDAFLNGLRLGRRLTKWHKVANGDLPRQDGHTCFSIKVLASNKKWVYYAFDSGKWFCGNKETKVIAWCEIPEFES